MGKLQDHVNDPVLLVPGQLGVKRDCYRGIIVRFSHRKLPTAEPHFAIVGLEMNWDIMNVNPDLCFS